MKEHPAATADHLTTLTFAEPGFVLRSTGRVTEAGVRFVPDAEDHLDRPEAAGRVSRETLAARIVELLAQPVGV
ncbi:hypothetical protein ABZS66_39300 [Dactylosporangium sp. NPDC005572]|uniref:hypothetical protein n=1 Tax=Dactylosporangium sp. NPDC005572 TaxID=3156889 RepID=UPI0033B474A6